MATDLTGKTAIVTGAAHGVGQAVARAFAEAGAKVMLCDANDQALAEAASDLEDHGERIARFACPLDDRLSAANLVAATLSTFDRVDILVNDLRTALAADFLEMGDREFRTIFEQSVLSIYFLCQAVAKKMVVAAERDEDFTGAIVNLSSVAAQRTVPQLLGYSVACAAIDQLTRSMATALAPHRIRVNGVAMGAVMVGPLREMLRDREGLREEITAVTPLGRIGAAEEVAEVVAFLASDRASFMTGQIVPVDGGRTLLDPLDSPIR